jgi:hypothetical protein
MMAGGWTRQNNANDGDTQEVVRVSTNSIY